MLVTQYFPTSQVYVTFTYKQLPYHLILVIELNDYLWREVVHNFQVTKETNLIKYQCLVPSRTKTLLHDTRSLAVAAK